MALFHIARAHAIENFPPVGVWLFEVAEDNPPGYAELLAAKLVQRGYRPREWQITQKGFDLTLKAAHERAANAQKVRASAPTDALDLAKLSEAARDALVGIAKSYRAKDMPEDWAFLPQPESLAGPFRELQVHQVLLRHNDVGFFELSERGRRSILDNALGLERP